MWPISDDFCGFKRSPRRHSEEIISDESATSIVARVFGTGGWGAPLFFWGCSLGVIRLSYRVSYYYFAGNSGQTDYYNTLH